jgi:hypothetical protein
MYNGYDNKEEKINLRGVTSKNSHILVTDLMWIVTAESKMISTYQIEVKGKIGELGKKFYFQQ